MKKDLQHKTPMSKEDEANEIIRRLTTPPPKYDVGDFTIEMWFGPIIKDRDGTWKTIGKKKQTKSSGD